MNTVENNFNLVPETQMDAITEKIVTETSVTIIEKVICPIAPVIK